MFRKLKNIKKTLKIAALLAVSTYNSNFAKIEFKKRLNSILSKTVENKDKVQEGESKFAQSIPKSDIADSVNLLKGLKETTPKAYVETLYERCNGNQDVMVEFLEKLKLSSKDLISIAKAYFYTYGNPNISGPQRVRQFLSFKNLNYGFSVQELIDNGKLPKFTRYDGDDELGLELNNLRINSLDGLLGVPNLLTLSYINLSGNFIDNITELNSSKLSNIKELNLNGNNLSELKGNAFNRLKKLEILNLSQNNLKKLNTDVFNGLNNLKRLSLDNNDLSDLTGNIFDNLNKLEVLSLHANQLKSLRPKIFSNLVSLEDLDLANNKLKNFDISSISGLKHLEDLNLSSNLLTDRKLTRVQINKDFPDLSLEMSLD